MSVPPERRAGRPGGRTIFVAITGLGSAALVTSISALSVGADFIAVAIAVIGGTVVLGVAAIIALLCALRMPVGPDRVAWLAAGASLALTAAGTGLRAGAMLEGGVFVRPAASEAIYMAGSLVLIGVLVGWPTPYRRRLSMPAVVAEAAVATAALAGAFWFFVGRDVAERAATYGGIGQGRMSQFLAFLLVVTAATLFSAMCAGYLRSFRPTMQWALLTMGAALMVAGDLSWLADVADLSWVPGSLGDFAHIAGHVVMAVGASLALDYARAEGLTRPEA